MTDTSLNNIATIAAPSKPRAGIFQFVANKIRDYCQAQNTRIELSRLDDRCLADMGIRRDEIDFLARHGYLPRDSSDR